MNTEVVLAVIVGAMAMAMAIATAYFIWTGIRKVYNLIAGIARLLKSLKQTLDTLLSIMVDVLKELVYMRQISTQINGPATETQEVEEPSASTSPAPQRQHLPPFPPQIYDRFEVEVPDAKVEDTDLELLKQTDRDLASIEMVENLRARGIEVEDDDTHHPGIVAESK